MNSDRVSAKDPGVVAEPEVPAVTQWRRFTADYKAGIVQAADACREEGAIGALLRREGLYSSQLTTWRRQCRSGALTASLRRKIAGASDLQSVVRTMKAVAASSIGQYESSMHMNSSVRIPRRCSRPHLDLPRQPALGGCRRIVVVDSIEDFYNKVRCTTGPPCRPVVLVLPPDLGIARPRSRNTPLGS